MNTQELAHKEQLQPNQMEIMTLGYMIQGGVEQKELELFCMRMDIEKRTLKVLQEHYKNDNELIDE